MILKTSSNLDVCVILPHLTTASSQSMEGKCFLTRNFLSDPTGAVLLGPAVLRAAFGTCEEEIRLRFFPTFPELREFLR